LNLQTKLFQTGSFNFKLSHIIIIGVLVLAFSTSFLIRYQPAQYGNELNEFDPFFNFRATEYIVENGLTEYFEWHDDKSWYPLGRDVSATSQVLLHVTTATTYEIFGGTLPLYDFTILFPAIIGSLTVVVIFLLVRLFAGTTAGLFASLLFAVSLPIIVRGTLGWFKSEPLGIFYGILGLYLFLSGIKSENKKIAALKLISGGVILSFAVTSWGGSQFFILPIGLFILAVPFVRKDHKFLVWSIPLFVVTFFITLLMFERPGKDFLFGLGGFTLIIPSIFLLACTFIQKISKDKNKLRNGLFLLFSIILIGSSVLILNIESNFLPLPTFRYLNAINPFLSTTSPLVDSVAEHSTTNLKMSFLFHSVWLIFSGIGVWILLSKKIPQTKIFDHNDMRIFVLILGVSGVYVSSVFIRLEVFASISLIVISSICLSILTKEIFKIDFSGKKNYLFKISYIGIILFLFITPLVIPSNINWLSVADEPPIILTGATSYGPSNDWLEALDWIKMNTPEDAKIASWWDYGYWITALSDRTTFIDNATLGTWQIQKMANIFFNNPNASFNLLEEWGADYVVIYVAGNKIPGDYLGEPIYLLGGGGDESKLIWMLKISQNPIDIQGNDISSSSATTFLPLTQFLNQDAITPTDYFWNETLLGKLIPFKLVGYYDVDTELSYDIWSPGRLPVSIIDIKYDSDEDPFQLVYTSPSFNEKLNKPFTTVFVYKINHNYIVEN
jgi:dolichyl-diphosphooligosaccharide--protein glycosyltransferase